jgi:hypothetical protein
VKEENLRAGDTVRLPVLGIPDEVSARYFENMHSGFLFTQVGYEGDSRQVWKVAINILTSSRGQPTRSVPSECRVCGEANEACHEMLRGTP